MLGKSCACRAMPISLFCSPSSGIRKAIPSISSSKRLLATSNGQIPDITEGKRDESMKGKIKEMWKKYGAVAIGTYLSVYLSTLGSIFLCLDYDVFNSSSFGLDPATAIQKV